ncbi:MULTISPECIES: hypothetical protein [unclassified Streptomyces]|uniref:hypothetical protein n=1 Tax=unclassified Streptomyces TaxID=2593676 RepID=UPI00368D1052
MDVEEVTDELYGLTPGAFTAARDRYAAEARRVKDPEAAKAIAALRRPTLAAWAANLLARRQPDRAGELLRLGEMLREAHRSLDGAQLRTASRQQHRLVTALARTAAELAGEAGQSVSDTVLAEIEQTLHAVLARPDVAEQWSRGRLAKVPEAAVGFGVVTPDALPPRSAPAPAPKPGPGRRSPSRRAPGDTERRSRPRPGPGKDTERRSSSEPAPDDAERRREARRLRALERARATAGEAAAVVTRRERERDGARERRRTAAAKAEDAGGRVERLERELAGAKEAARRAREAVTAADGAVEAADRALDRAREAADRAEAARLDLPGGD